MPTGILSLRIISFMLATGILSIAVAIDVVENYIGPTEICHLTESRHGRAI